MLSIPKAENVCCYPPYPVGSLQSYFVSALNFPPEKNFLVPSHFLLAYLAGRIDGDGSIDRKYRSGIRIAYGNKKDAEHDVLLFGKQNVSLYFYKAAGTWVIYLRKKFREEIINKIAKYSIKLCPVETSPK